MEIITQYSYLNVPYVMSWPYYLAMINGFNYIILKLVLLISCPCS